MQKTFLEPWYFDVITSLVSLDRGVQLEESDVTRESLSFASRTRGRGMVYNMAPVASDVTRESHALDVITSILRYDSRSNLLQFFC